MSDTPSPAGAAPAAEPGPAPITGPIVGIAEELRTRFSLPETALKLQRATRLWVDVDQAGFLALFDHVVKGMGFSILCTITGLDLGTDLGLIYHMARDGGIMVNVKTRVPKGKTHPSVTPWFPGAAIYEREVEDLLGASFDGRPDMPRYPLPEDWPQGDYPLLKDWKPRAESEGAAAAPAAAPSAGAASPAEKGAAPNV